MGPLIFVVDSEPEVCELARECLEAAGYEVQVFSSCDAVLYANAPHPSLVLVRMAVLGSSGPGPRRQLFSDVFSENVRLVVLLDDDAEENRLLALESGADDCIVKPFSPRELVARVQALLRRTRFAHAVPFPETPDLLIDTWAMKLSVRGIEVPITTLEFRLIEYLARHRGQVFTRDFLLDAVWGDMQFITPRSVDACIRRIREKIEPNRAKPTLLKTIRGVGYRLDAVAAWQSAVTEDCDCSACRTKTSAARLYSARTKRRRPAVGS
jgi:DNA-binding response OmpR family regulator